MPRFNNLEIRGNHLRVRINSPKLCKRGTFRTNDVGSPGHSQRIACINRKTGRFITQAWIFPLDDIRKKRHKTFLILKKLGVLKGAVLFVRKFDAKRR